MKKHFIDTNIIVYANDTADIAKQKVAISFITDSIKNKNGVISLQVLQEYANIALNKLNQEPNIVIRQIKILEMLDIVEPDLEHIKRAVEIKSAYKTSFLDAGIIAAAEKAGCDMIISEDFSSNQFYAGLKAVNLFV